MEPYLIKLDAMSMFKGVANGLVSSISFGLIPLFTLPVLAGGMSMDSLICYRFSLATVLIAGLMLIRKESFRISKSDIPVLILAAVFYDISSMFLLWAYDYLGSGLATILHFTYPVLTTLIMMIFFNEKSSLPKILAIIMAVGGVILLSVQKGGGDVSLAGVAVAVFSGLGYASYMVSINVSSKLQNLKGLKLTFYVFLIGDIFLIANSYAFGTGMQPLNSGMDIVNLLLLAFVCTILSNQTLIVSIKNIGSVRASVLGAMEPVTAVIVGLLVFNELMTWKTAAGMLVILAAVIIIILSGKK